jgi:hypothetical protein
MSAFRTDTGARAQTSNKKLTQFFSLLLAVLRTKTTQQNVT